jgi:hypothetical protein
MSTWRKVLVGMMVAGWLLVSCSLHRRPMNTAMPAPTQTPPASSPATKENADYLRALQSLNYGKYLGASDAGRSQTTQFGWDIYHYPLSECRCLLGDEYLAMARKGTESTKTVLWMEGGGLCYPGHEDCTTEAKASLLKLQTGLASSNTLNPVKDWNFIYVPYCDGSIHLRDSDADYDNNSEPDHWHWGLKNTSAAVRLMKELFPQSQEILIAGCSAGGYGTIGTVPMVRLQFPQADLHVLNESGLGLMNPSMRASYDLAYRTWNLDPLLPPDCPQCRDQLIYLYSWLLARDSRLKVGVFSSYHDATFIGNWNISPEDFKTLLLDTTASIRKDYPDVFQRYLVEGDGHCILNYSYTVNGVSIWEWIRYMLGNDPRWTDTLG